MRGVRRLGIAMTAAVAGAAVATFATVAAQSVSPPLTLAAVQTAMAADRVNAIEYAGAGYSFGYQQAPGPGEPWPLFITDTYRVSVDYTSGSMRLESTRAQGERPPRGGGGQPVAGNPRSIQYVSGQAAWSENARGAAQPTPGALRDRRRQLWMTPHGLAKAAVANQAQVEGRTLAFTLDGLPLRVTVDDDLRIWKVDYSIDSPVLGDVPVQVVYLDYRTVNGVPFPTKILEKTDGYLTLDIDVTTVTLGAAGKIAVPETVATAFASLGQAVVATAAATPRLPMVDAAQIAPGLWHLTASGYGSMLVEFRDFLLMFEAPIDDARSEAVQAWVKQAVPGKPMRYVVNSHAHFDHAGGLRWYAAEGVTIITHEMNRSYYEHVWDRPRTVRPDRLALAPRRPAWRTMTEQFTVTDGTRTLELHQLKDNGHNPYILVGYLPAEKVVLYGDMYNPPPGDDPRDPGRTNEYVANLHDNLAHRLKLDVRTIVPVHGRAVPFENLEKAIGLKPVMR